MLLHYQKWPADQGRARRATMNQVEERSRMACASSPPHRYPLRKDSPYPSVISCWPVLPALSIEVSLPNG